MTQEEQHVSQGHEKAEQQRDEHGQDQEPDAQSLLVMGSITAMKSNTGSDSTQSAGGKKTSKPRPGPSERGYRRHSRSPGITLGCRQRHEAYEGSPADRETTRTASEALGSYPPLYVSPSSGRSDVPCPDARYDG